MELRKLDVLFFLAIGVKLSTENLSVKINASPDPQTESVCLDRQIVLTCFTDPPTPAYLKVDCLWEFYDGRDYLQNKMIEGLHACTFDAIVKVDPVTYNCTCIDVDDNWNLGSANITLFPNAEQPIIRIDGPANYTDGSNLIITGTIVSNTNPPFRLNPSWRKNDGKWNPNARVEYKQINATTYVSLLHISNYSSDDVGNYTLSASNVCGLSTSSLYIGKKSDGYDGHTGKQHILETAGAIGGGLIIAAMVFALLAFGICYYCRKRKRKNGKEMQLFGSSSLSGTSTQGVHQRSTDYGTLEAAAEPKNDAVMPKWRQVLLTNSDELCSKLAPVANGLFGKLSIILSEVARSKVISDRYLCDYDKISVMIEQIKDQNDFYKLCDAMKELKHETLANKLKSAAND